MVELNFKRFEYIIKFTTDMFKLFIILCTISSALGGLVDCQTALICLYSSTDLETDVAVVIVPPSSSLSRTLLYATAIPSGGFGRSRIPAEYNSAVVGRIQCVPYSNALNIKRPINPLKFCSRQ